MSEPTRPVALDPSVAARMSRQRRRDTGPEMLIRKELHRLGYRYRVDAPLPGLPRRRADILFSRAKVAVFIDGCFWHVCPLHATTPSNNKQWWSAKLDGNVARDRNTDEVLLAQGWHPARFWEHEPISSVVKRIVELIDKTPLRDRRPR